MNSSNGPGNWKPVTANEPCPICGKPDWCAASADGSLAKCQRVSNGCYNTKTDKNGAPYYLHRLNGESCPQTPAITGSSGAKRAEPDRLHEVYSAVLSELPLSDVHRQNLQGRGLSDDEIDRRGYRSLQPHGRVRIAGKLRERVADHVLLSIPGFVAKAGTNGPYITIAGSTGLLIPVRDVQGRIIALKVRRDKCHNSPKYVYISSSKYDGPGPGSPGHVPLDVRPPVEVVRLTEGELKADIATALSDIHTISIPGASVWRPSIEVLKRLQARTVRLAFDADAPSNHNVARSLRDCAKALGANGFTVELERWPIENGKGIDDVLAAGHTPEILTGDSTLQAVEEIADAAGLDDSQQFDDDRDEKKSQATVLVELALEERAEMFHTPGTDSEGFATIPIGDDRRGTFRIRTKRFREWLRRLYWTRFQKAPNSQAMQDALGVLTGKALFDGSEIPVAVRVAEHNGSIYIDLANEKWQAIEVTAVGWQVVDQPPVKFIRPRGVLAFPTPVKGGHIDELRPFVNVANDADWVLIVAWIVAAYRPTGPYPVLVLHGEQGSAKSTACRILRMLLDPNAAPLRSEPKEARDLMIAATNAWCLMLENLSGVPAWLSDALCRLATGGGFATRELYTDGEEKLFDAQRPVVLNGIPELATRPDLLDRTITITLQPIPESKRRTERELYREFDAAHPRIFGAFLDAVSTAMKNLPHVKLDGFPRMADFEEWVVAAEPAFGNARVTFKDAYSENRESANEFAIESSIIAGPLLALMHDRAEWAGTATELMDALEQIAGEKTVKQRDWPKKSNVLSGKLRRIAPNLRGIGIDVNFDQREPKTRRKIIRIRKEGRNIVRTVRTVRTPEKTGPNAAGGSFADRSGDRSDRSGSFAENRKNTEENFIPNDVNDANDESRYFSDNEEIVKWTG